VPGNTVTLKFTAKSAISGVTATIQGQTATVTTTDNISFTATATLPQGTATGTVGFTVNYSLPDGTAGYPASATTDGTGVYLVDESDVIRNISTVATLIDSSTTTYHTAAQTKVAVDNLFDGNISTFSDFRIGTTNACNGSYIIFDFKSGNQVNLTTVELLARQDLPARAGGIVFQGSNDGATWTTIAGTGANTVNWQTFAVSSPKTPYRYIRIYNGGTSAVTVTPTFFPQNNGAPVAAPAFTIQAGQVRAIDNVLPALFSVASAPSFHVTCSFSRAVFA